MPKEIIRDCLVEVDGVDLSNRASSVSIEEPADEVDQSTFGGDYKEFGQGLKDATITVTFHQDYAATEVDETLSPLHQSGEPFEVRIVPRAADPVSATNPQRRMPEARLFDYSPIAGAIGEASTTDVTFRNAGQQGILRETSESS